MKNINLSVSICEVNRIQSNSRHATIDAVILSILKISYFLIYGFKQARNILLECSSSKNLKSK